MYWSKSKWDQWTIDSFWTNSILKLTQFTHKNVTSIFVFFTPSQIKKISKIYSSLIQFTKRKRIIKQQNIQLPEFIFSCRFIMAMKRILRSNFNSLHCLFKEKILFWAHKHVWTVSLFHKKRPSEFLSPNINRFLHARIDLRKSKRIRWFSLTGCFTWLIGIDIELLILLTYSLSLCTTNTHFGRSASIDTAVVFSFWWPYSFAWQVVSR